AQRAHRSLAGDADAECQRKQHGQCTACDVGVRPRRAHTRRQTG
nr:hypothetical protein [Tanacetum cinerariifolium]